MRMRKFAPVVALAALLAVPAIALGGASAKEGTLVLKDADARTVYIKGTGAFVGRVEKVTRIWLIDVVEADGSGPSFTGCDDGTGKEKLDDDGDGSYTVCTGSKIKFKLIGGRFEMKIKGAKELQLSVVGRSKPNDVWLRGMGDADSDQDGVFSLNGDSYRTLPATLKKLQLGD